MGSWGYLSILFRPPWILCGQLRRGTGQYLRHSPIKADRPHPPMVAPMGWHGWGSSCLTRIDQTFAEDKPGHHPVFNCQIVWLKPKWIASKSPETGVAKGWLIQWKSMQKLGTPQFLLSSVAHHAHRIGRPRPAQDAPEKAIGFALDLGKWQQLPSGALNEFLEPSHASLWSQIGPKANHLKAALPATAIEPTNPHRPAHTTRAHL